jgi:hypothetical protein
LWKDETKNAIDKAADAFISWKRQQHQKGVAFKKMVRFTNKSAYIPSLGK